MSHDRRKNVFGVSDQVTHKPACPAMEAKKEHGNLLRTSFWIMFCVDRDKLLLGLEFSLGNF